ncbi:hypothetical protein D0812_28630 [Vibrio owensii]|uniref:TnsA endonuclease N-terminal domain-containing protein n=2 Tax=Vibrio owensii TaxID=696485 RepID=A0AAP9GHQ1_9VIBR|nr:MULTISPECIES: TnsA endonuclease N-terminal domain-containing protein [Vibrio harveyi group]AYO18478.1 hypothetical protein D0812_28630 [Vibrio owensii]AYO23980.1 hypothetical protein D0856_19255 [Vibrio owensii]KNY45463.1 hypothetical protein AKG94_11845 [Vibrio harveyi]QGH50344.1 hypothetical protein APZ19_25035 [Vibrio owensii]
MNTKFHELKEGQNMQTRKFDQTSKVKPTIAFYSRKNRAMMPCESRLEADALLSLEFDPRILKYVTQPCSITYMVNGKSTRYTPDVLVIYHDKTCKFLEIKPLNKAQKPKFIAKFLQLQDYFSSEIGHPIELILDKDVRKGEKASNMRLLYRFFDVKLDQKVVEKVLNIARRIDKPTLEKIEHLFCELGENASCAWALVANQSLKFNNHKLLTRQTTVEVAA